MARDQSKLGCGTMIVGLAMLVMAYGYGLSMLGDQRQWWHYLAALPIGLLSLWAYSDEGEALFKWLTIPVAGVGLMIWLIQSSLYLWMIGAGVAFFVIGVFCGTKAVSQRSAPWAINSLIARLLGLVMGITGLVMHFVF